MHIGIFLVVLIITVIIVLALYAWWRNAVERVLEFQNDPLFQGDTEKYLRYCAMRSEIVCFYGEIRNRKLEEIQEEVAKRGCSYDYEADMNAADAECEKRCNEIEKMGPNDILKEHRRLFG